MYFNELGGGIKIYVVNDLLVDTEERYFPESKHRSKRVLKKLIKKYGGIYKKVPGILHVNGNLYLHPAKYDELKKKVAHTKNENPYITTNSNSFLRPDQSW